MKQRFFYILLAILLNSSVNHSQNINAHAEVLVGNLRYDSRVLTSTFNRESAKTLDLSKPKKNPMLSGLFSLLLPGAGEFYSGEYLKAAIFVGIEVAIVATALSYDKKGDDQTSTFESFADGNWSVVKYAEWLNRFENATIPINPNTSLPPWERVNWDSLNFYEKKFSHKLPKHGDQQYYELIGKYPQYSPGWNAFDPNEPDYHVLPAIFLEYSKMRGKANDYYAVATTAVKLMYINHFLSMLDAIWSAVNYNSNLELSVRLNQNYYSIREEFIPTVSFRYAF